MATLEESDNSSRLARPLLRSNQISIPIATNQAGKTYIVHLLFRCRSFQ